MGPPRERRSGQALLWTARALASVPFVLWVLMLWIPVRASPKRPPADLGPPPIVVTALGGPPLDIERVQADFALIGLGIAVCALSACLLAFFPRLSLRPYSIATIALGLCAITVLVERLSDPPMIMWDAVDDRGRRIVDTVIGEPATGSLLWLIGCLSLLAAGVCGLLGEHRRGIERRAPGTVAPNIRVTARPRGNRTQWWAQRLPWVAVAAWVLMIRVPIFDSGDHGVERLTITSLGRLPVDLTDFTPAVVLPWAGVLIRAATATWFAPFAHWSSLAGLTGLGLLVMQAVMVVEPPRVRVRSTGPSGDAVSAYIVGDPAAGLGLWTVGGCALVAAGVAGAISDRRRIERRARRMTARRGRILRARSRLLPLVAVTVWIVTLFVPVLDSFNEQGPRIEETSLGEWAPGSSSPPDPLFLNLWIMVVFVAVLGLFCAHTRWWNAVVILSGGIIVFVLFTFLVEPPLMIWDGQTPDGMPTGGMEIGRPAFGFGLWAIGAAALIGAGCCGFLSFGAAATENKHPRPRAEGA